MYSNFHDAGTDVRRGANIRWDVSSLNQFQLIASLRADGFRFFAETVKTVTHPNNWF
jgi:hypothetical protein